MKIYKNTKRYIDPRYFLNETADRDTIEPSILKEELEVVLTDPEAKEVFGDDVLEGQDEASDEVPREDNIEETQPIEEGESHPDHPGRGCDKVHPDTTHQAWLHLELMEDIEEVLNLSND